MTTGHSNVPRPRVSRRPRRLGALMALLASSMTIALFAPGSASAGPEPAEPDPPVVDLDEAPAVCEGTGEEGEFAQGVAVDCVIPIVDSVRQTLPSATIGGTEISEDSECVVAPDGVPGVTEDRAYLCEDIATPGAPGESQRVSTTLELSLDGIPVGGVLAEARWTATSDELWQHQRLADQAVLDGKPLIVRDPATLDSSRLHLVIRERRTGRTVTRIPARDLEQVPPSGGYGEPGDYTEYETTPDLARGTYRLWFCAGAAADDCSEQQGGYPFEVVSPRVTPLVDGHNGSRDRRINVVFVGSGLDTAEWEAGDLDLRSVATDLLGLDGPRPIVRPDGPRVRPDRELAWGPFSIKPLSTVRGKFNFFTLDQDVRSPFAFSGTPAPGPAADRGFRMPHVAVVVVDGSAEGQDQGSLARLGDGLEVASSRDELVFGTTQLNISPDGLSGEGETNLPTIFAHEFGHIVFGLSDEYAGPGPKPAATVRSEWNCAVDRADGRASWSRYLGQTDPFAAEMLEELRAAGVEVEGFDATELTRARVTRGECTDTADGSTVRPSQESIMNSNFPVFGPVNRARVTEVMSRFGRPASTPRVGVDPDAAG